MPAPAILREVPEHFETKRLLIRAPRAGDGVAVHAAVVESLAELRASGAFLPWAMGEPSLEASEVFCREGAAHYLRRTQLTMLLFEKEGGQFIGGSGLHEIDWAVPRFAIGYWCRTSQTRRGLITEAVEAITRLALEELGGRRVACHTDEENRASRRVVERAGFVLEGILRHDRISPTGVARSTCIYSRTR